MFSSILAKVKTTEQSAEVITEEVVVSTVTTQKVVEETTSLDFEVDIRQEEEEGENSRVVIYSANICTAVL